MDFKDIPRVYIGDNVFIPYYEGFDCDDGGNPYHTRQAFDLESVKKWVEENSKGWFGGVRLKFIPIHLVPDTNMRDFPREISLSYTGMNGNSVWKTSEYKVNNVSSYFKEALKNG